MRQLLLLWILLLIVAPNAKPVTVQSEGRLQCILAIVDHVGPQLVECSSKGKT